MLQANRDPSLGIGRLEGPLRRARRSRRPRASPDADARPRARAPARVSPGRRRVGSASGTSSRSRPERLAPRAVVRVAHAENGLRELPILLAPATARGPARRIVGDSGAAPDVLQVLGHLVRGQLEAAGLELDEAHRHSRGGQRRPEARATWAARRTTGEGRGLARRGAGPSGRCAADPPRSRGRESASWLVTSKRTLSPGDARYARGASHVSWARAVPAEAEARGGTRAGPRRGPRRPAGSAALHLLAGPRLSAVAGLAEEAVAWVRSLGTPLPICARRPRS